MSTFYNLIIFATAVFVIGCMLICGARVNKMKLTHEFYCEKIAEESNRLKDERAKAENKKKTEAKMAGMN